MTAIASLVSPDRQGERAASGEVVVAGDDAGGGGVGGAERILKGTRQSRGKDRIVALFQPLVVVPLAAARILRSTPDDIFAEHTTATRLELDASILWLIKHFEERCKVGGKRNQALA